MSVLLQHRQTLYTQWKDFKRKPLYEVHESHICVLKGTEEFKMVSPIFREQIYAGVDESINEMEVPVDFFDIRYEVFPWAK